MIYQGNDYRNYLSHYGRKGMRKGKHLPGTTWWKDFSFGKNITGFTYHNLANQAHNNAVDAANGRKIAERRLYETKSLNSINYARGFRGNQGRKIPTMPNYVYSIQTETRIGRMNRDKENKYREEEKNYRKLEEKALLPTISRASKNARKNVSETLKNVKEFPGKKITGFTYGHKANEAHNKAVDAKRSRNIMEEGYTQFPFMRSSTRRMGLMDRDKENKYREEEKNYRKLQEKALLPTISRASKNARKNISYSMKNSIKGLKVSGKQAISSGKKFVSGAGRKIGSLGSKAASSGKKFVSGLFGHSSKTYSLSEASDKQTKKILGLYGKGKLKKSKVKKATTNEITVTPITVNPITNRPIKTKRIK